MVGVAPGVAIVPKFEPYAAITFGAGIGIGNFGGLDFEGGISVGHYEHLGKLSIAVEGQLIKKGKFVGGGMAVPFGSLPGDPGTKVYLVRSMDKKVLRNGAFEFEYTWIISGPMAVEMSRSFLTDNLLVDDIIKNIEVFTTRKCFVSGTPISLFGGAEKAIEHIKTGDTILAFDPFVGGGRGELVLNKVVRTFTNVTEEWLRLTWIEGGEKKELVTTPGHQFLAAQGGFKEIESLVSGGRGTVVLADGSEAEVTSERIVYSSETADMFEQAEGYVYPENGNLALKPVYKKGWKTYNFEVEDFHTYVAGGVRVHNDSWSDGSGFEYANWLTRDGNATVELIDGRHQSLNGEDVLGYRLGLPSSYRDTPSAHGESLAFGMARDGGFSNSDIYYASWREHTLHRSVNGILPEAISDPRAFSKQEARFAKSIREGERAAPGSNQNSGRDSESSTVDTTRSRETGIGSGGLGDYDNDGEVSAREHNRAEHEGKYGNNKSDGESGGNGGGQGKPVLLDLDGDGLEVTALDRSTVFLDSEGDGFLRRTAWAGEGDGVLYFDPDGRNEITEKRQFIFTEWDPTATSDLEAIASVFDTNSDGVLDAGDADFSKFKLMVTNADGSIVSKTLAELGITALDLTADATNIELSDGSVITGKTTFTRSDGTTGTVGDMLLASEAQGHRVEQVETTDGSGNRVLTSTAYAADGSKAYEIHSVTSTDGLNITNRYDDNGDGVVDRIQTIVTVVNPDQSRTETETNLSGSNAATAVLETRIVTTTSVDAGTGDKIETIERDLMGGGWYDQREVRTEHLGGSWTIVVSDLAQDGSVITSRSETVTSDGSVRTDGTDADGDSLDETIVTHTVTVHADDSRTETVATTNRDGSLRAGVQEDVSADGRTKTILRDLDGDGDDDIREEHAITVASDGSTNSTLTIYNDDNSLRTQTSGVRSPTSAASCARPRHPDPVSGTGTLSGPGPQDGMLDASQRLQAIACRPMASLWPCRSITSRTARRFTSGVSSFLSQDL